MNDPDSLRRTYRAKLDSIREKLEASLGVKFRERDDFDRDGVVLRSTTTTRAPRLFISHEFLSDFTAAQISSLLASWRVAEQLRSLPYGTTLFVANDGTFTEPTEGSSLREATDSFESLIPSSSRRADTYNRVFSTLIDGRPLGEMPMEMIGDPSYYVSYSDDFADLIGLVYLLDGAGYRKFTIHLQLESDSTLFEIRLDDGSIAFADFKRALFPTERRAASLREELNAQLRRAVKNNSLLQEAVKNLFIQVTIPVMPSERKQIREVAAEIERFIVRLDRARFPRERFSTFDATEFPLLARLSSRVYVADGVSYLSVEEGAKSFDPYQTFQLVGHIVREESLRRSVRQPMWLCISTADQITPGENKDIESFLARSFNVNDTPFEQIIVGSVEKAFIFKRHH